MSFPLAQIAFAGHIRPGDIGDRDTASTGLETGFALIRQAAAEGAQLLTGLADGADLLAAQAWDQAALGGIHVVYPFLTDKPAAQPGGAVRASTWLDGAALEAAGYNAHLAQTRWLIGAADLLVVLWDGKAGRGAGGTADAVRLALQHGIAVLWILPNDVRPPRLIAPAERGESYDFMELLEQLARGAPEMARAATADAVAEALAARGFEAGEIAADAERDSPSVLDRLLHATLWKTYAGFRRALGGRVRTLLAPSRPPEDLSAEPGFATLTRAHAAADQQANRLSAVHRSQQLILLIAAVAATAIGSSPAVWPQIKIYAVLAELTLALLAVVVWSGGTRAARHARWSEARRLAEQLRLERAAWALGLSSVDSRDAPGPAARAARVLRRRAGLAPGAFDAARVLRWGGWAIEEIVGSQARYNQVQGHRNETIAHRIHIAENFSFGVFVVSLVAFAGAWGVMHAVGQEMPHWIGGGVLMLGAIVPALGAASLALESTLAFAEQGQRSQFLATRLAAIQASITDPARLDELQRAAKAAMRLHGTQEDRWGEDADRRRLLRGG